MTNGKEQLFDKNVLQYKNPGEEGECELIIGFDFGTSATKVVIQAPTIVGSPSYAVDFADLGHKSLPYLLPTVIGVSEQGTCVLGASNGGFLVNDIKIELLSKEDDMKSRHGPESHELIPEVVATAYSALLLRYVRKWFLEEKQDLVSQYSSFTWSLNLGVPSPSIEENEENKRFSRVGKAAWMLSLLSEEKITLENTARELQNVDETDYWDDDDTTICDFAIIPEIAAGAVGYAQSDQRREGLHVIIDVGASTVDVCSFNLYSTAGDDRYSLLTADVQLLGSLRLHLYRIRALEEAYQNQAQELRDQHDPLEPIATDIDSYLIPESILKKSIAGAEESLKQKLRIVIRKIIMEAKVNRDPHAEVWRAGRLPIILIGGGSKQDMFREVVDEFDLWLRDMVHTEGALYISLQTPESFKTPTTEYHRLAVAWGLSHRAIDLGDVTPADQIGDIDPPEPLSWEDKYISKDQV